MKKIILTLAIGMLSSFAFPQSYHKLIRTNTHWDNYYTNVPEWCYTGARRIFFTNQDTLINGFTYKISKLNPIKQVNPGLFCPPFIVDTLEYFTDQFLREDTVARKVYIYSPSGGPGGSDQLFYDFSLLPGDTLQSPYTGNGAPLILDSIITIVLNNGETRKEFSFSHNDPSTFNYIEGIGGSFGLLNQIPIGFTESLGGYFCVKENSANLWGDQCDYGYVGQNEVKNEVVSVYPNPANEIVYVSIPPAMVGSQFILVNLHGEEVFSCNLKSTSNSVAILNVISGVYFYQIKSNQLIHTGKLTIL
ncbi:MAG: T9SS type A sorting domain-containing protein [Bacteroidota bacterium]